MRHKKAPLTSLSSERGLVVGLFSSYSNHLEQGWRLLKEANLSPRTADLQQIPRSLARITDEEHRLMMTDYETGMSAYELAEKYDLNRGTIMKHLAGAGVRSRVAVPTNDEIFH